MNKMKIHFVGIGGIGVSALARYYLSKAKSHEVSGSDLVSSEITDQLKKIGVKVFIGPHKTLNLKLCARRDLAQLPDLVIYSPAVEADNPELKVARKLKISCQSYPQALGELTKKYWTIAVAGTHGKGTTTAMISLILIEAGFDPTVIIGTKLKEFGNSNFRKGKSKYLVIEADEYKSSFLNYRPKIIVLTVIDKDHLDYFKTLDNIIKTFKVFAGKLPLKENLIANFDDKNSLKLKPKKGYSLKRKEAGILRRILKIPGDHIISDALAALTLARTLRIKDKVSFKALSRYQGAWRRFEQKQIKMSGANGKTINLINDYAHHPTEISVTLEAVRQKYPNQRITCVFQPHQYQRTFYLFGDFVKVLAKAEVDQLILTDIYSVSGRESPELKKKVSSGKLAEEIRKRNEQKKVMNFADNSQVSRYLKKNLEGGEVLVIMGAGNVYDLEKLLTQGERKAKIK